MEKFNNLICNNAYGILGLTSDIDNQSIIKRYKELEKLLKIGRNQSYEFDLEFFKRLRTVDGVNFAYKELQQEDKKIYHNFFRISANKAVLQTKNMILVQTVVFFENKIKPFDEIKNVIDKWERFCRNKSNLDNFKRIYLSNDKIGIDEDVLFKDFEKNIVSELTKVFSDIANLYNNNEIISYFISKFEIKDDNITLSKVDKIYAMIYKVIENLNKLNISEDGVFDDNEKRILKECIDSFKISFDELKKLGVYETSKTKIVRDDVAKCLRKHAIDIGNNLKEYKEALNLNDFMEFVAGTGGLKSILNNDGKILKDNLEIQKSNKNDYGYNKAQTAVDMLTMAGFLAKRDYAGLAKFLSEINNLQELTMLRIILATEYNLDFRNGRIVYASGAKGQGCFPIVLLGLFFMFAIFFIF